jgi:hypothetical protein
LDRFAAAPTTLLLVSNPGSLENDRAESAARPAIAQARRDLELAPAWDELRVSLQAGPAPLLLLDREAAVAEDWDDLLSVALGLQAPGIDHLAGDVCWPLTTSKHERPKRK